jgi:hypothetical protein
MCADPTEEVFDTSAEEEELSSIPAFLLLSS